MLFRSIRLGNGSVAPGLAHAAMEAATDGRITFFPSRYAKSYLDWLGEERDWCISRQLWWGHRIPVWSAGPIVTMHPTDNPTLDKWEGEGRICLRERKRSELSEGLVTSMERAFDPYLLQCCIRNSADREALNTFEGWGFFQDSDVLDTWFSSALWPDRKSVV